MPPPTRILPRYLRGKGLVLGFALALVAACDAPIDEVAATPDPLGQFRLGHNIAIADHATTGPFSRDFTENEIEASVQNAVANRLRRYNGDGLYHLGIVIGRLELAEPSGPASLARQPVMVFDVTAFDDGTGQKLNEVPERITAGGGFRTRFPIIGTRFIPPAEVQLQNLSVDAARQIEAWLAENPDWFAAREGQIRVPFDARVLPPDIDTASVSDIGQESTDN